MDRLSLSRLFCSILRIGADTASLVFAVHYFGGRKMVVVVAIMVAVAAITAAIAAIQAIFLADRAILLASRASALLSNSRSSCRDCDLSLRASSRRRSHS